MIVFIIAILCIILDAIIGIIILYFISIVSITETVSTRKHEPLQNIRRLFLYDSHIGKHKPILLQSLSAAIITSERH